jgi:outer membrane protein TolC
MRFEAGNHTEARRGSPVLLVILAAGAAAAGVPGWAAGQESSDPPTVLTLERARALAMESNPRYRRSLNDLTLTDPAQRQLWAKWLPTLDLSAGTSQSFVRREIGTDDFGNPIPNPEAVTRWNSSGSQNLSFGLDLFNGRNIYAFSETRAQVEVWTRGAETTLVTVLSEVDRQFFEAQRGAELLEVEAEILRERERDLEVARRLFNLAVRNRTDVLGAELAVRRQEQTVENVRSDYEKARIALQTTLGRPDLDEFEMAPAPVEIFDPAILPEEDLVAAAMVTNPRVLGESARVRYANAGVSSARSDRWPTLRLNGNLGRSAFGPDQSALFDIIRPSSQSGGSLSLSIGIPLFQQFQTSYSIAQAQVELQNAQETERETRLDVEREIRERLIELRNAYLSYGLEEIALALAQERAGLVREEYQLATKSFEDLQVALVGVDEAQRAFVQARYAFLAARIALEEALGQRLDRFQES